MRPRKGRCRIEVTKANIAYKFELMPTREQKRIFAQAAGCRRFVWNKAIELQKRCLEQEVPFLKYTELAGRLVLWEKEDDMLWLLEAPSQALQQCLMDASAAIQAFKAKKKGLPKVPSSGRRGFLPHSVFRKFARRIGTRPTVESASRRQASCDSESRVRFKARSSR